MPYYNERLRRHGRLLTCPKIIVTGEHAGMTVHADEVEAQERCYDNYAIRSLAQAIRDYSSDSEAPATSTPITELTSSDIGPMQCPITLQLMADPVVALDGHTYEREAIEAWRNSAQGGDVSPLTRISLQGSSLVPNKLMQDIIDDYNNEREHADLPALERGLNTPLRERLSAIFDRFVDRTAHTAIAVGLVMATPAAHSTLGSVRCAEGESAEGAAHTASAVTLAPIALAAPIAGTQATAEASAEASFEGTTATFGGGK